MYWNIKWICNYQRPLSKPVQISLTTQSTVLWHCVLGLGQQTLLNDFLILNLGYSANMSVVLHEQNYVKLTNYIYRYIRVMWLKSIAVHLLRIYCTDLGVSQLSGNEIFLNLSHWVLRCSVTCRHTGSMVSLAYLWMLHLNLFRYDAALISMCVYIQVCPWLNHICNYVIKCITLLSIKWQVLMVLKVWMGIYETCSTRGGKELCTVTLPGIKPAAGIEIKLWFFHIIIVHISCVGVESGWMRYGQAKQLHQCLIN